MNSRRQNRQNIHRCDNHSGVFDFILWVHKNQNAAVILTAAFDKRKSVL